MKVIIAGTRTITNPAFLDKAIREAGFLISEIVSGGAPGPDTLGERWARLNKVPIKCFYAEWDNLEQEGAVVRKNRFGKLYNANAGFFRNTQMADYADGLIALWDGKSNGTDDMIKKAQKRNLSVFVLRI